MAAMGCDFARAFFRPMAPVALAVIFVCFWAPLPAAAESIAEAAARFEDAYREVTPSVPVHEWFLPFDVADRKAPGSIRVVSVFGAPRQSFQPGHLHSGLDLVPRRKTKDGSGPVSVLAMGPGVVCSVHLSEPHTTVVVRHLLPDGSALFTAYKHLAETWVEPGQEVDASTKLGRLFTAAEAKRLGGNYDHLHLEVRTSFDDRGTASWLSMTREELEVRFLDPLVFLKSRLAVLAPMPADRVQAFVAAARELLGKPYRFGARLADGAIDCLGLLFYAAERVGCGWRSYSVYPTRSIVTRELGTPVPGLDPVARRFLDFSRLRSGDVLWLLMPVKNPAELPIGSIDGQNVWVWHTGIYTGDGRWIHADYTTGRVAEGRLASFLEENGFAGLLATRMSSGPAPARCLRHKPMASGAPARPAKPPEK